MCITHGLICTLCYNDHYSHVYSGKFAMQSKAARFLILQPSYDSSVRTDWFILWYTTLHCMQFNRQGCSPQNGWSGFNQTTFWDTKLFLAHTSYIYGMTGRLVGSCMLSYEVTRFGLCEWVLYTVSYCCSVSCIFRWLDNNNLTELPDGLVSATTQVL